MRFLCLLLVLLLLPCGVFSAAAESGDDRLSAALEALGVPSVSIEGEFPGITAPAAPSLSAEDAQAPRFHPAPHRRAGYLPRLSGHQRFSSLCGLEQRRRLERAIRHQRRPQRAYALSDRIHCRIQDQKQRAGMLDSAPRALPFHQRSLLLHANPLPSKAGRAVRISLPRRRPLLRNNRPPPEKSSASKQRSTTQSEICSKTFCKHTCQNFSLLNGAVCVMIGYGTIIRKGHLAT